MKRRRANIPALGIVGACVAIAGQLGEARGLLIFPSLEDPDQVPGASAAHTHEDGSLESGCLSLMFESATELPRSMRREAMDHGWQVHPSDAYPVVKRFDASGVATPLDGQDVTIATACALALTAFLARHAAILSASVFEPVCESYFRDRGFEVLLTVPYEAYDPNHTDAVAPDDDGRRRLHREARAQSRRRGAALAGGATGGVALHLGDETLADGRRTVVGSVRLTPTELRIETDSEARAGALRERIEAACGDAIRHCAREQEDPLAGGKASVRPRPASPPPSPEEEKLNAKYKARHYAEWPDMPLSALNGRTPRECVKTAAGRREVDLLLKYMEHMEHQASLGRPLDFSVVREELGVATPR